MLRFSKNENCEGALAGAFTSKQNSTGKNGGGFAKFSPPFLFAICLLALAPFAFASTPHYLTVSGRLSNAAKTSYLTQNLSTTFALYDAATGGTALWSETKNINYVVGTYSTTLGDTTALDLNFRVSYWLGVTVGADSEMTPRKQLASVPYSMRVNDINAMGDLNLTGKITSNGNLVFAKDSNITLASTKSADAGELIKLKFDDLTNPSAKATISWYDANTAAENNSPQAIGWFVCHNQLGSGATAVVHKHCSIETSLADGSPTSRLAIQYGVDHANITTYDSDFTVGGSGGNFRVGGTSVMDSDLNVATKVWLNSAGTASFIADRAATTNFSSLIFNTANVNQWTFGLRNESTNDLHLRDNVNLRTPIKITQSTGDINFSSNIRANDVNCSDLNVSNKTVVRSDGNMYLTDSAGVRWNCGVNSGTGTFACTP
ncbi:MAG: hypothetical protein V1676_03845 [Candidatus Diapherotrites archaeon]